METYRKNLPELQQHPGKHVLILGERVVDVFDSYGDAMRAAYAASRPGEFMVKRIPRPGEVAFFTRNLGR
jgi:hypothetical protein